MEVGARPYGRLKWSSLGQGLTPQVVSTSYLVLGPVPYALAGSTYHRVTKGQQGFCQFIPLTNSVEELKTGHSKFLAMQLKDN